MADEEVATKAPESDAQEQSAVPDDTKVDQGASMGVSFTTATKLPNHTDKLPGALHHRPSNPYVIQHHSTTHSLTIAHVASGEQPTGVRSPTGKNPSGSKQAKTP